MEDQIILGKVYLRYLQIMFLCSRVYWPYWLWRLFLNFLFVSWWCSGCRECQFYHWTSLDWQGNIWKFNFLFSLYMPSITNSDWWLMWVFLQDPTEQVQIDNFMVQELDGTVNEWGWCKQKVCLISHLINILFCS